MKEPIWHPIAELSNDIPLEAMEWLKEEASLTARLRLLGDFEIKILQEKWDIGIPEEYNYLDTHLDMLSWQRQVVILLDHLPFEVAHTVIPASMVAAIPALTELGTNSIGDLIFIELKGTRSRVEYARLTPEDRLYQLAVPFCSIPPKTLWARRSLLDVEEHKLLVTDIFVGLSL
jgi:chorismate lyase